MKGGFFKGTISALKTSITGTGATTSMQKEKQSMEDKL
jgi:hypothetical protein